MTTHNQAILVDEIVQAFHSHGNLHLIFGVASGEVSSTGEDIYTTTVHLAIPESRINHISNLLNMAFNQKKEQHTINENTEKSNLEIIEKIGDPIFYFKSTI
jgi:hypothetical protein